MADFVAIARRLRDVQPLVGESRGTNDAAVLSNPLEAVPVTELPLIRLAAYEAFARSFERLLHGLALDVLGRELAAAPCDLERLMLAALECYAAEEPVSFAVREPGVERVGGLPVRGDPSLAAGDLVVELRDGCIDARFAVRLAGALDRALEEGA